MRRTFALFAAFTGMGTLFLVTVLVTAIAMNAMAPRATAGSGSPSPNASGAAGGPSGDITITAFDLGFEPAMAHVDAAGSYRVHFVNDGGTTHDVTFADGTTISADAHSEGSGLVAIPAAGIGFICSVPGHADAGMKGEVMVAVAAGSGDPSPATSDAPTAEQLRDLDAAVTGSFPAATEGLGNQVLEPEILPDGTKQWELTASVIQWETEPGKVQEAYAYNGMVPGPQLRAQLGDRIRIILHNELPEPTTIHSHGLLVPPDMDGVPVISQPAVMPGE
ncbi:MAG: multicopper oxidase domain-containing protein, partial [Chloroflexota bacterium]